MICGFRHRSADHSCATRNPRIALPRATYYSARQPNRHADRVGSRRRRARESNRKNIDATGILILATKEIRK